MHLIIDTNGSDISQVMKSINVSYANYFNKTYRRCGHLFQDRFKSEVVDNDRYLTELTRYIHLNPVRAKIVSKPGNYEWSSYQVYVGLEKDLSQLVDAALVLELFSSSYSKARQEYIRYVNRDGDAVYDEDGSPRVPIHFPDLENEYYPDIYDEKKVEELIEEIANRSKLCKDDLVQKNAIHMDIRNKAILEVRKVSNLSMKKIGQLFGGLSESAVSKIINSSR